MAWIDAHYAVICAEKRGVPVAMIRNLEISSTVNLIEKTASGSQDSGQTDLQIVHPLI